MNWVGGVRRRVLLKAEEQRRQEQFFACHASSSAKKQNRQNRNNKVGQVSVTQPAMTRPIAVDLHSKAGIGCQKPEEFIYEKIKKGTAPRTKVQKKIEIPQRNVVSKAAHKYRRTQGSGTCSGNVSFAVSGHPRKIQIKPSSLHGPFSRYLLQLEEEGIRERTESRVKEKLKGLRWLRNEKRRAVTRAKDKGICERNQSEKSKDISHDNKNVGLTVVSGSSVTDLDSKEQNVKNARETSIRKDNRKTLSETGPWKLKGTGIHANDYEEPGDITIVQERKRQRQKEHESGQVLIQDNKISNERQTLQDSHFDRLNKVRKASEHKIGSCSDLKDNGNLKEKLNSFLSLSVNDRSLVASRDGKNYTEGSENPRSDDEIKPGYLFKKYKEKSYSSIKGSITSSQKLENLKSDKLENLNSNLLAGAPRIRRVLTLSPDCYRGRRIWEPLHLPVQETSTKRNGNSNEISTKSLVDVSQKVQTKISNPSHHGNTSMTLDIKKRALEADRLNILLGTEMERNSSRKNQEVNQLKLGSCMNDPLSKNVSSLKGCQTPTEVCVTYSSKHKEKSLGPQNEGFGNVNSYHVGGRSDESLVNHGGGLLNNLRNVFVAGVLSDGDSYNAVNGDMADRPRLGSMTRNVVKVESSLDFVMKGKDKTPYMERDLPMRQHFVVCSNSGGSSNISKTPSGSLLASSSLDEIVGMDSGNEMNISLSSDENLDENLNVFANNHPLKSDTTDESNPEKCFRDCRLQVVRNDICLNNFDVKKCSGECLNDKMQESDVKQMRDMYLSLVSGGTKQIHCNASEDSHVFGAAAAAVSGNYFVPLEFQENVVVVPQDTSSFVHSQFGIESVEYLDPVAMQSKCQERNNILDYSNHVDGLLSCNQEDLDSDNSLKCHDTEDLVTSRKEKNRIMKDTTKEGKLAYAISKGLIPQYFSEGDIGRICDQKEKNCSSVDFSVNKFASLKDTHNLLDHLYDGMAKPTRGDVVVEAYESNGHSNQTFSTCFSPMRISQQDTDNTAILPTKEERYYSNSICDISSEIMPNASSFKVLEYCRENGSGKFYSVEEVKRQQMDEQRTMCGTESLLHCTPIITGKSFSHDGSRCFGD